MIDYKANQQKAILDGKNDVEEIKKNFPTSSERKKQTTLKIEENKHQKKILEDHIQNITHNLLSKGNMTEDEIDTHMKEKYSEYFEKYDYLSYRNRELVMYKDSLSHNLNFS